MVLETEYVFSTIEPALQGAGYALLEVQQDSGADLLRIIAHKHEGGISHQDCAAIVRLVEEAMLEEGVEIREMYRLEITSAGIHRKLKNRHEMEVFTGYPVLAVYKQDEDKKTVQGRLAAVSENGVAIETEEEGMLELEHRVIKKIQLV